jgi:hypothetical protein
MGMHRSRKLTTGLAFVFLTVMAGLLGAQAGLVFPDVIQQTKQGHINWSKMTLYSEAAAPWQRLAADAQARRGPAKVAVQQQALGSLFRILHQLPVDGSTSIQSLSAADEGEMATHLQNMVPERAFPWLPFHVKENTVRMGLSLSLSGTDGLLTLLTNHYPLYELPPLPRGQIRAAFHHSGVVIDARHLPFIPALGTRVFNASGELVYGITHTDRTVYVEDGHILYLSDPRDPRLGLRAGSRFLLMVAKNTRGTSRTDLELFDADSDRMLASSITRDHLRRCRVVVLCKSL